MLMVNADKKLYSVEKVFEICDNDIDENNINKKYNKKLYVNTFYFPKSVIRSMLRHVECICCVLSSSSYSMD